MRPLFPSTSRIGSAHRFICAEVPTLFGSVKTLSGRCAGHHAREESVRQALEGNLCRCTGYTNIVRSILAAVPATNGHAPAGVEVPAG